MTTKAYDPTIKDLRTMAYELVGGLCREKFFPETMVILGRESLMPAAYVLRLIAPRYVMFRESFQHTIPGTSGKTLVFMLYAKHDEQIHLIHQWLLGRPFRIMCFLKSCSKDVHYVYHNLPERVKVILPGGIDVL